MSRLCAVLIAVWYWTVITPDVALAGGGLLAYHRGLWDK